MCPALQNKTSQECPASSHPLPDPAWKGGVLSTGQERLRPAPLLSITPTHGIQQDGGWRVPPSLLPPCHFLCPQYKTTHGHKVLCNLFMALLPDPAARAGSSLALPLLILVPLAVLCRLSTTETSPSVSLNGGGLIRFFLVVQRGCSVMSTSTQLPCLDTHTHTHTQTHTHREHENTHKNLSYL